MESQSNCILEYLGLQPNKWSKRGGKGEKTNHGCEQRRLGVLEGEIHQNKQGKSKDIPKETTVLLVKDLTKYITKLAESESAALDVQSGELPVCFDADAGGGRFLAVFTFLNREDGDVR